jgi:hypothetical protein
MVMDRRTMALAPAQDQQVKLAIPLIDQISGVSGKRERLIRKLNFCVCVLGITQKKKTKEILGRGPHTAR